MLAAARPTPGDGLFAILDILASVVASRPAQMGLSSLQNVLDFWDTEEASLVDIVAQLLAIDRLDLRLPVLTVESIDAALEGRNPSFTTVLALCTRKGVEIGADSVKLLVHALTSGTFAREEIVSDSARIELTQMRYLSSCVSTIASDESLRPPPKAGNVTLPELDALVLSR